MKRILTLLSFILILTGRAETPWVALGGVTSPANNSVFINPPSAGVSLPYTVPGGETLTITGYGVETLWGAGIFIFTQSMDTINAGGGYCGGTVPPAGPAPPIFPTIHLSGLNYSFPAGTQINVCVSTGWEAGAGWIYSWSVEGFLSP